MLTVITTPTLYGIEHDWNLILEEEAQRWWNRLTPTGKVIASSLYNFCGDRSIAEIYALYCNQSIN